MHAVDESSWWWHLCSHKLADIIHTPAGVDFPNVWIDLCLFSHDATLQINVKLFSLIGKLVTHVHDAISLNQGCVTIAVSTVTQTITHAHLSHKFDGRECKCAKHGPPRARQWASIYFSHENYDNFTITSFPITPDTA